MHDLPNLSVRPSIPLRMSLCGVINICTIVCPPVRGFSPVQSDSFFSTYMYTNTDLARHNIFRVKVDRDRCFIVKAILPN